MLTNVLGDDKTSPTDTAVSLTTDDVFHLLSNSRRRAIILTLLDHGPMTKRELSDRVAARELDIDRDVLTSSDKQSIRVSLHQNHLPKLEDSDVITVGHNTISIGPNASELKQHIQTDSLIQRFVSSFR